jgi:hypothetical protein
MSRRSLTGRADLLLALAEGEAVAGDMAARLGFERIVPIDLPEIEFGPVVTAEPQELPAPNVVRKHKPIPFWRAESFEVRDVQLQLAEPAKDDTTEQPPAVELADFDPLASIAEILTRLRHVTGLTRPGRRIDVDQVVSDISRGRQLTEIPYANRRSWGQDLHVVIDLARRLAPYRQDQLLIGRLIRKLLPKGSGTVSVLRDNSDIPVIEWPADRGGDTLRFSHSCTVLVLSDLGTLQQPGSDAAEARWRRIGWQLRDRECTAMALVPCRPVAEPTPEPVVMDAVVAPAESKPEPKPEPKPFEPVAAVAPARDEYRFLDGQSGRHGQVVAFAST